MEKDRVKLQPAAKRFLKTFIETEDEPSGYGPRDFTDEAVGQRLEEGLVLPGVETITPGANIRRTNPVSWQTVTNQNLGAAAQRLLKSMTPDLDRNSRNIQEYQDALAGKADSELGVTGNSQIGESLGLVEQLEQTSRRGLAPGVGPDAQNNKQMAQQLLNAFLNKGLSFEDLTGTVTLGPGEMQVKSKKGWSAAVNPRGGEITVGPFGLQGTWGGDKSIQATFDLRPEKAQPVMMGQFLEEGGVQQPIPTRTITTYDRNGNLQQEETEQPYRGFGLEHTTPPGMFGPSVDAPMSAGRRLMELQTEEYAQRNPGYRYQ